MYIKVVYPPHIWGIDAVRKTVEVGDIVGEEMEDGIQEMVDNITILTSRESGIARREEILGIIPKSTDTLEDRRVRVHLRWYNKEMYTERSLREKLDGALGPENYQMAVLLDEKTVEVRVFEATQSVFKSVLQLLEDIVPLDYLIDVLIFRTSYVPQYVSVLSVGQTKFTIKDGGVASA